MLSCPDTPPEIPTNAKSVMKKKSRASAASTGRSLRVRSTQRRGLTNKKTVNDGPASAPSTLATGKSLLKSKSAKSNPSPSKATTSESTAEPAVVAPSPSPRRKKNPSLSPRKRILRSRSNESKGLFPFANIQLQSPVKRRSPKTSLGALNRLGPMSAGFGSGSGHSDSRSVSSSSFLSSSLCDSMDDYEKILEDFDDSVRFSRSCLPSDVSGTLDKALHAYEEIDLLDESTNES